MKWNALFDGDLAVAVAAEQFVEKIGDCDAAVAES